MEYSFVQMIENLFYQKILLYNDLLHCFKEERASLVQIDVDKLWPIAKEKEDLCDRIESIRQTIASAVFPDEERRPFHADEVIQRMPHEYRDKFRQLSIRLTELKREIDMIRKESKVFIEESLTFLDEMIAVISGKTQSRATYNHKCGFKRSHSSFLLNREV